MPFTVAEPVAALVGVPVAALVDEPVAAPGGPSWGRHGLTLDSRSTVGQRQSVEKERRRGPRRDRARREPDQGPRGAGPGPAGSKPEACRQQAGSVAYGGGVAGNDEGHPEGVAFVLWAILGSNQ